MGAGTRHGRLRVAEENDGGDGTDKDAEIRKWKAMARKHEAAAEAAVTRAERAEQQLATKDEAHQAELATLKAEVDTTQVESLRWKIAAKHQVSDEDVELFLVGTDEATLTKQAERIAGRLSKESKEGPVVPKEGTQTPKPPEDEKRAAVRELFGGATAST